MKAKDYNNQKIKTWRIIKLGTGLKTAADFRKALKEADCRTNSSVDMIIAQPGFQVSSEKKDVELVVVSVAELGFKKAATLSKIYKQVKKLGLDLCPNEVGPQLRLQYRDQSVGGWLTIGMKPINGSDGDKHIFIVSTDFHGYPRLFTKLCSGELYQTDSRLVFLNRN